MRHHLNQLRIPTLALALTALLVAALPAEAQTVRETRSFDARTLTVRNLIGEIDVEGHSGSQFEVEIMIHGDEATRGTMDIVTDDGSSASLNIVFPEARTYIYPKLGSGSRTKISLNDGGDGGWLSQILGSIGGRGRIEVRGSGSGLEVWADLKIKVPAGGEIKVLHGVGEARANGVNGNVELAVRSGHVEARDITGDLVADTGSGHVEVDGVRGNTLIDTGSGHVEAMNLDGDEVNIDTGSGHVDLEGVRTLELNVDTGSGHVNARRVSTDAAEIDTGSGGVTLELDEMGDGRFNIDTGSGRINLRLPADAGGEFHAETGSGGIDLDLDEDVSLQRMERDEVKFRMDGGNARVTLSTGSGGIRIRK